MRRASKWAAGAVLAAAVLGGCTAAPETGPLRPSAADADLVGVWQDRSGRDLPDGSDSVLVVASGAGSVDCSCEHVSVFLEMAWPAGTELHRDAPHGAGASYRFVRDPGGSTLDVERPADLDVALPASVRTAVFSRAGNVVSVDEKKRDLYVTRPDGHTERWARLSDETGCA